MKTALSPVGKSALVLGVLLLVSPIRAAPTFPTDATTAFTDRYCSSCHNDVDKEGGLDLTSLSFAPDGADNFALWVKIHDRVQAGEMPPKEKKRPNATELAGFMKAVGAALTTSEQAVLARDGRSVRRRLNRSEYENALRDLLHAPWLQIQAQLPEDGEAFRFNKVSSALDVSHVHMTRYMAAADYALREAMSVQLTRPPTTVTRYYARQDAGLVGGRYGGNPDRAKFPVLGFQAQPDVNRGRAASPAKDPDPQTRELEAVGWVSSNYVTGFASRWGSFRAPVAGKYRLRFSGYTLWVGPGGYYLGSPKRTIGTKGNEKEIDMPKEYFRGDTDLIERGRRDEPITVYAYGGAENRRLDGFDVTPEPGVVELEPHWLIANEVIVTDASRFFRSRPTGFRGDFTNALAQRDGQPAVAFRWMEVEGPIYDDQTAAGYRLLFGDLPMKKVEAGTPGVSVDVVSEASEGGRRGRGGQAGQGADAQAAQFGGRGRRSVLKPTLVEVVSENQPRDAERLLRGFMQRAYRRPVQEADVQLFLDLIQQRMSAGLGFAGSMLAGYTAVLSSPEFISLEEKPGRLDDNALATRLALFLWNSEPDEALRARAAKGELQRPEVLRTETERMLNDAKSQRFVASFLDYWLELRRMEETTPSTTLYNDYYLDDSLTEASVLETRLFFTELLQRNLPSRNIVDSDFTYLNGRLATHYGIAGVEGAAMRRVALPVESLRGGFMTQASVLKVTANGTTTSPVLRGKWITERIMGQDIPQPPAAVPAVEPDIRGAVTIRQQLDKHRADESCAACHRKIDPPGFALEGFDVMGAARDRYRATAVNVAPVSGFGKNGWPYAYYFALPAESDGVMPDGRPFKDVRDFKRMLLENEAQIARNLVRQLSVFATGAPVRFSDRAKIEDILVKTKASNYGVRNIVQEIVLSDMFRNK